MDRRRALAALLVCLLIHGAPAARAAALDEPTLRHLERALSYVNLSVEDLGWDKRPISDDFRLSCVNEALDHPLTLADRAVRAEADFVDDPVAAAAASASWLDVPHSGGGAASLAGAGGWRSILPGRFRGAPRDAALLLAHLVNAYQEASRLREEAMAPLSTEEKQTLFESGARLYTDESEEDWDMSATLAAAKKVDISRLVLAQRVLAEAARTARDLATRMDVSRWKSRSWKIDGLTVALGGLGPDKHRETIVLDGGGDDLYTAGRVAFDAGGNARSTARAVGLDRGGNDRSTAGAIVVDISGDDIYRGAGQGFFGVALIVDLAGNDHYSGRNFVQGGAAFGASLLVDVAGDDRYEADQCSQGAAFFGVGMLFDLAGSDHYTGARFVQGFGGTRGLGALSDLSGNDRYDAGGKYTHAPLLPENYQSLSQGFGFGLRGASASGGVGILADHKGNDVYSAEVFGQGASYWFSLGILVDSSGHDKYNLYQYGQGAGIHLSAGVLFDRAGNDAYSCNNGVAQGSGHDWGTGLLWDLAGDDGYQGSGMSQGGTNANGIGMIIDRAGNDSYAGWNEKNQGDSFFSRGTIGLGVLLDLGGKDRYTHGGKDGAVWTRGTVGVGLDTDDSPQAVLSSPEKKP